MIKTIKFSPEFIPQINGGTKTDRNTELLESIESELKKQSRKTNITVGL